MDTIMKSFKTYLEESKQVYEYKVKIAGDCPKDCAKQMKIALEKYGCTSCSAGKRTPIQESPLDFPDQKFSEVNIFDIKVTYPTTAAVLREYIAEQLKINSSRIRVRTPFDIHEEEINLSGLNAKKGESLLEKDYEKDEAGQKMVGEKHLMSFLKGLKKSDVDIKAPKGTDK